MKFSRTRIDGVVVIDTEPFVDERGAFLRSFCADEFQQAGLEPRVVQGNFSHNRAALTLRGFHFQIGQHQEAKTITCVTGSVHDIVVDLRPESSTYLEWFSIELSADSRKSIHVPRGCANAFLTLQDDTICHYYMATQFAPDSYKGFHWNDPQFKFDWPRNPRVISERDESLPRFESQMLT